MRPAVVLPLALLAVAALLAALFTLGSGSGAGRPAGPVTSAPTLAAEAAPEVLAAGDPRQVAPTPAVTPEAAVRTPEPALRATVQGGEGGYANRIHGRVTDPEGRGLADARVELKQTGGPLGPLAILARGDPNSPGV
jgi:hypothetical protein